MEAGDCEVYWQAIEPAKALMIETERSEFTECDFEELAPRLAEEIAKAISTKPASNPEIRARALQIYLGRKSEDVGRELLHLCGAG